MGSPVPPSSVPISQPPEDHPPRLPTNYLLYFLVSYYIGSLICFLVKFYYRHRLAPPVSPGVHDPDPTPSDGTATATATATATNVLELLKSDHIVIYIGDSPLSSEPSPSDESGSCPICLDEFAEGEEVRALPQCRHAFHRACIDQWLVMGSQTCPVCRVRLTVKFAQR